MSVCVHLAVYVCLYVCVGSRVLSLLEGDKFRRGWQHHWGAGSGEGGNLRLCRKSPRTGARRAGPLSCVRGPCHPASECLLESGMTTLAAGRLQASIQCPLTLSLRPGSADASWISTRGSWLPQEWGWAEAGTSRLSPGPGASGLETQVTVGGGKARREGPGRPRAKVEDRSLRLVRPNPVPRAWHGGAWQLCKVASVLVLG